MPTDDRRDDGTPRRVSGGRPAQPTAIHPPSSGRRDKVPPTIEDLRLKGGRAPSPPSPHDAGGEHQFGARYTFVCELGRGGFGSVCKAYDNTLGEHVAIKTIKADDIPPRELVKFLEKFKEEARNARELSHPHIVRVYSYEEGPPPFIVMGLVDGGTLADRLEEQAAHGDGASATLSSDEVCALGIQVAEALDYVHSQGILHRDIKPSNIFTPSGGGYKLGDFGIARRRKPGTSATHSVFKFAGTPYYMSPEQWLTPSQLDGRSDLFSLCVVLYEALTGKRPYDVPDIGFDPEESRQASERAQRQVRNKFRALTPIRQLAPAVPPAVAAVIERGLSADADQRQESCGLLAAELRAAMRAVPVPERRPIPWPAIGAALAGLLGLAAVSLAGWYALPLVGAWLQGPSSATPGPGERPTADAPGGVPGGLSASPTPSATPTLTATIGPQLAAAERSAEDAHRRARSLRERSFALQGLDAPSLAQRGAADTDFQVADSRRSLARTRRDPALFDQARELYDRSAATFAALQAAPPATATTAGRPATTATPLATRARGTTAPTSTATLPPTRPPTPPATTTPTARRVTATVPPAVSTATRTRPRDTPTARPSTPTREPAPQRSATARPTRPPTVPPTRPPSPRPTVAPTPRPTVRPTATCDKTAEQLAAAWLVRRAAAIESAYASKNMQGSTALSLVSVSGAPPTLTVTYSRVDTVAGTEQPARQATERIACTACRCE